MLVLVRTASVVSLSLLSLSLVQLKEYFLVKKCTLRTCMYTLFPCFQTDVGARGTWSWSGQLCDQVAHISNMQRERFQRHNVHGALCYARGDRGKVGSSRDGVRNVPIYRLRSPERDSTWFCNARVRVNQKYHHGTSTLYICSDVVAAILVVTKAS